MKCDSPGGATPCGPAGFPIPVLQVCELRGLAQAKEIVMRRALFTILVLFAPAFIAVGTAGCEKTEIIQQSETRHESEPQMVSPGKEVVE